MEQLKFKDILGLYTSLTKKGIPPQEIMELPLYLGNDDELNGIHTGWFVTYIDSESKDEDTQYIVEMINEDSHNIKLNGKGILIS